MDFDLLLKECVIKATRSSGSGGQHVNKVATKIELQFNVNNSEVLNEEDKALLLKSLKSRLTNQGVLILQCGETRSQLQNKERAITRFKEAITKGLEKPKKRKKTKVPKAVKQKRLENKKRTSEKKVNRKKPDVN
ncbi:MAG: aminoacyl-tRNA hydrolase [Flavobacteriaceae bacterium]|nr:aminoacyl-tRNA hydrolase [Bacteroidia bacterium]NNK83638.1 aminoacyl-tRNA hydrolase [Flavobacteriaceae bacterium]